MRGQGRRTVGAVGRGQARQGKAPDGERTVTTVDPSPDTLFYRRSQRQIFAQGVGPIYREKRVLNYCQGIEVPACAVGTNYVIVGEELRERLVGVHKAPRVRDRARDLHGKAEMVGHGRCPPLVG